VVLKSGWVVKLCGSGIRVVIFDVGRTLVWRKMDEEEGKFGIKEIL
jgi:hypothetical protein